MYPTVILKNLKAGTFHPMPFRPAPRPSDDPLRDGICRHRSIGHYTDGFGSLEAAQAEIASKEELQDANILMDWDGESSPHCTLDFSRILAPAS